MTQLNLPLLLPSVAQMVEDFANTAGQPKDTTMARKLVMEEFVEWFEAAGAYGPRVSDLRDTLTDEDFLHLIDPKEELKELADLIYVVYGYARAKGYDLEGAVQAVHDNNMGRMFQEDGTIKRRDDGKIIKNPSYPKVDLSPYVP